MGRGKEDFLKEFGEDYGYPNGPKTIDEIRADEFKRLDQNTVVYLDHAGATLYSELQMESIFKDLNSNVYGNPHSQTDSSLATLAAVRKARQQVLDYCNASAKDYKCIFTSGATAALKLVGESFPWSHDSCFMYTMENHNSVLGIREYALSQGAATCAVDVENPLRCCQPSTNQSNSVKILQHPVQRRNNAKIMGGKPTGDSYNLFAFPSECNFSGLRFGLDLVNSVKEESDKILEGSPYSKGQWMVLIDAAKGVATQPPDLSKYHADFVVISFYKLFGYPTGLGALIVQHDAAKLLKKTYFSGGTVAASSADMDFVKRREGIEELFEDGTISFLSIASIHHGFKVLNSLTVSAIRRHTASLTKYVKKMLLDLRHDNGAIVCKLYEGHLSKIICNGSGPIVAFNLKRPDGSWFGYREVEKLASLSGIHLRTGCFCNPGACAKNLGLSNEDLLLNLEAGHACWDDNDIIHEKPTGAVRVSFGYMSTYEDAQKFVDFIRSSFLTQTENGFTASCSYVSEDQDKKLSSGCCYLKSITIYPIKSCGGFGVGSWPLSSTGLLHDREWLLQDLSGDILTQKKVPEMCLISTFIDLDQGMMFVESPRCSGKLQINLQTGSCLGMREEIIMHGQRYKVCPYEADVNLWFSNAVGCACTLIRSNSHTSCLSKDSITGLCRDVESRLNFANEAQFLLISDNSVSDLNSRLKSNAQKGTLATSAEVNPMRFRPNLVISGVEPYVEDRWRSLKIGNNYFMSLGGCNRCQMINLVHQDGQVQRLKEPLKTLSSYRRLKGKILFGILLRLEIRENSRLQNDAWLRVGQEVYAYRW